MLDQLKLKCVRRCLRRYYSPQGREQFLAVMHKRDGNKRDGKELPREIIEKAQAMVERRKKS